MSNKILYNSLLFNKIESSIGVDKWVKVLDIQEKLSMKPLYKFICSYLEENKLKIFRWKLMQYIIPTIFSYFNEKFWIIIDVAFVEMKKTIFITLLHVLFCKRFGKKIYNLFKSNNWEFTLLKLKHLIFGYTLSDNNYYGVNYFITILGFSIYKSYYLSEQKTKM